MNNVTLVGNLCRDITLRKTQSDSYVGDSAIAVKRDRKEADGNYLSDFFDIKLFGTQAEFGAKYCRKGDRVAITGRVQVRDYVTKDGVKGRAIEVIVNSIENLSPKAEEGSVAEPTEEVKADSKNLDSVEIADDDLPF